MPTDPASRFQLRLENVGGLPARKNIIFSPRFPTRTYTVQYQTNLAPVGFNTLAGASTTDAGVERTVTDLNATNSARFYRVRIDLP